MSQSRSLASTIVSRSDKRPPLATSRAMNIVWAAATWWRSHCSVFYLTLPMYKSSVIAKPMDLIRIQVPGQPDVQMFQPDLQEKEATFLPLYDMEQWVCATFTVWSWARQVHELGSASSLLQLAMLELHEIETVWMLKNWGPENWLGKLSRKLVGRWQEKCQVDGGAKGQPW